MYVIRLTNGNLQVPHSALVRHEGSAEDGRIMGQGYVEIGPGDPDYERLLGQALTPEELEGKRREWRDGDEALLHEFEEWKARQNDD